MDGLKTKKQRDFVRYYCLYSNATKAAIKAGYSKKTAHLIGHENLRKPKIKKAIKAKERALAREIDIERADMVKVLLDIQTAGINISKTYRSATDRTSGLNAAIRAATKICDVLGLNSPTEIRDVSDLSKMSIKELKQLLKEKE